MHIFRRLVAAGALLLIPAISQAEKPAPCPQLLFPGGQCATDVGAAVAACCDCATARNHGAYVNCVAHAVNALRQADCLDSAARRSMKRCAARSTCGKPGFVTCCRSVAGVCLAGFCAKTDPPLACTTSEECPAISKCGTKRDADTCIAIGGTPGTASSCCAACGQ